MDGDATTTPALAPWHFAPSGPIFAKTPALAMGPSVATYASALLQDWARPKGVTAAIPSRETLKERMCIAHHFAKSTVSDKGVTMKGCKRMGILSSFNAFL